jgi:hypothetical protein
LKVGVLFDTALFSARRRVSQNFSALVPKMTKIHPLRNHLTQRPFFHPEFGATDMPGKYLDNACVDCWAVKAALNIRNRQLCQ